MLGDTEQGYNTNEKELLAIVRALRNYLYEVAVLTIYTDQSLIYSISDKKSNSKLKRWKNLIEEYEAKLVYRPGHQNVVACTFSTMEIMKKVKQPLNSFKNQIVFIKNNEEKEMVSQTIFPDHFRHSIYHNDLQSLISKLKEIVTGKRHKCFKGRK